MANSNQADCDRDGIGEACDPVPGRYPPGDRDGDYGVIVDELILRVNLVLRTQDVAACPAGDADGDGRVTIDEVVMAVRVALEGWV